MRPKLFTIFPTAVTEQTNRWTLAESVKLLQSNAHPAYAESTPLLHSNVLGTNAIHGICRSYPEASKTRQKWSLLCTSFNDSQSRDRSTEEVSNRHTSMPRIEEKRGRRIRWVTRMQHSRCSSGMVKQTLGDNEFPHKLSRRTEATPHPSVQAAVPSNTQNTLYLMASIMRDSITNTIKISR